MGVRIVVPVVDEGGLDARLSEHFGRAPYFAVIELDEVLRSFDPVDPVKYDFALFGLGVHEKLGLK